MTLTAHVFVVYQFINDKEVVKLRTPSSGAAVRFVLDHNTDTPTIKGLRTSHDVFEPGPMRKDLEAGIQLMLAYPDGMTYIVRRVRRIRRKH